MLGISLGSTSDANKIPAATDHSSRKICLPVQTKIQVALLLDTSSSMDGLIEQTKSQLWQIVNELATARYSGVQPALEIALYEYGNDGLPHNQGYIRQVLPFTADLDKLSEELFKLRTNGGSEYCGQVIDKAVSELSWTNSGSDLKMIYIAGNEPFNQGTVTYQSACKTAITKGIVVNTIYCGGSQEGINSLWKDGSDLADGKYFNIDQNQSTVYIETPWDEELVKLNDKLNETYVAYGENGERYRDNQREQDQNAGAYGKSNLVNRVASKSSGMYKATGWDLVDATEQESFDLKDVKKDELPKEMQNMTEEEQKNYIGAKKKEREEIQNRISELNKKRTEFIAEKEKELGGTDNLGNAMKNSVHEIAEKKNYTFE